MQSMRWMGVVLVAATWMAFDSSTARADTTAWSTNAAACVPVSAFGVHVTAGAVTAGAGVTVTLYCGITKSALSGGFNRIEITYKGGSFVLPPIGRLQSSTAQTSPAQGSTPDVTTMAAVILTGGIVTAELIEMSKATGAETVKCGIQSTGSSVIATESQVCNSSSVNFDQNFYYVRIVLKSGIATLQQETIYGTALTAF
jgi:hypothetical protein